MQIQIPQSKEASPSYDAPRKITPLPSPVATFSDEVRAEEIQVPSEVGLNFRIERLYETASPAPHYASEQGLYFAGRRPSCTVVGLGRSNSNRSDEVHIIPAEHILQLGKLIRENEQPYNIFLIDALPHDALSGVEAIVRETVGNTLYVNRKPLVSVVEKEAQGLLLRLQERYSDTPLRFIEAKKYGADVIDAQLFGQPRY